MSNASYWFTIAPYVHIARKKKTILLYNTLNGKSLHYSDEPEIAGLVKRLSSSKNLLVVKLTAGKLGRPVIGKFVKDIREAFMGDLIDTSYSREKPVQMMPIASLQNSARLLKKPDYRSVGEQMMKYLGQVTLYINDRCGRGCSMCSKAFKQFHCCTAGNAHNPKELDFKNIKHLFPELQGRSSLHLHILGGTVWSYSRWDGLIEEVLRLQPCGFTLHTHYLDLITEPVKEKLAGLRRFDAGVFKLNVLVPPGFVAGKLQEASKIVHSYGLNMGFNFIVESEDHYNKADFAAALLKGGTVDFQPFFNGDNLDFFMAHVFPGRAEILSARPAMRDIHVNAEMNRLNFGKLTVLSQGAIYANLNTPSLGLLGRDSLYQVLYKEMDRGVSWHRTRKHLSPCRSCVYQDLCPPVSNYTYALGRNDLCRA